MAVRKILLIDKYEKQLRQPSEAVKKLTKDVKQLVQDLKDTLNDPNVPGVGLAAPQIGALKRVFGVRLGYEEGQDEETMSAPMIMINPEIVEVSETVERGFDACLSIPGMMGYTDRNLTAKVRYRDEDFVEQVGEYEGYDVRVLQHELDHLDGILFTDRLATLDDLYVYVRDDRGRQRPIPYPEIVRRAAAAATEGTPAPPLPALPSHKPK